MNNQKKRIEIKVDEETKTFLEKLKKENELSSINQVILDIINEYKEKYMLAKDPKNSPFLQEFIEQTKETQGELNEIASSVLNNAIKAINENTELVTRMIMLQRYNSDKLSIVDDKLNYLTGDESIDENALMDKSEAEMIDEALKEYERRLKKDGK
ncbi:hypothetical protein [Liquorilactobacillus hordei]|uniref:hypothetical protein n=1 Tax=Liquorilactobacillus hordei TaxID=468911 RepID=UPI001CBB7833|nr:hypothetical protein [Liquorilactobacillus hordei]MBZ2406667.1 hypothetical protein [Liquorilactobacillus hordei]